MSVSARRYSTGAIVLHWLTVAAIVIQLVLALRMQGPRSPETFAVFQLHKSVGVTVLVLTLLRLAWRLTHRPPPEPATLAPWERRLAQLTHAAFYVLLIAMPLTGWLMVSTSPLAIPTLLYGVFPFPDLPGFAGLGAASKAGWREAGEIAHESGAFILIGLLALHVAGALKHQLFAADEPVFGRMAPGAKAGRRLEPRLAMVVLGALAAATFAWTVRPPLAPATPTPAPVAETQSEPTLAAEAEAPPPPVQGAVERQAGEVSAWTVDKGSKVTFRTAWGGQPIEGRFGRWHSQIRFDPKALDRSQVRVVFSLASVDTGDGQRDASLASADWFDAAAHAEAVYTARRFEKTGPDTYLARGELSLRGVSHPVPLRFKLTIDGDTAHMTGRATVDRLAFGVGQGEFTATDQIPAKVGVDIDLTARRTSPP